MEGAEISVAEDPHDKPPDVMLARVDPIEAEFWSIRVTEPEETPGIRAFGAFTQKDTLVALTWEYRELIGDAFDDEVDSVRDAWTVLFVSEEPFGGASLDECLTNYRVV